MPLLKPKQIDKLIAAPIKISNLSVGAGNNSTVVTTQIGNALSLAGNNGGSVPFQVSTSVAVPGVVVSSPVNRTEIFNSLGKEKLVSVNNDEVYGRLEFVSNAYILKFFYLTSGGIEVAYNMPNTTTVDFDFVYRFTFDQLPTDALVSSMVRNVAQDPKGQNAVMLIERLTVTSTNILSTVTNIPNPPLKTVLLVNGKEEFALGPAASFNVSGTSVAWNANNAGYSLETTDVVYIKYFL